MGHKALGLAALGVVLALTGCARDRNAGFVPGPEQGPLFPRDKVDQYVKAHNDKISESIGACFEKHADEGIQILALSGGGQWGAYGASFLKAWKDHDRPRFDIVTGVSTGALQATMAFLGEACDDEALIKAYEIEGPGDVHRLHFPLMPWSDSIYTSAPLRGRVEKLVTDCVIRRVAEQHRSQHRRLFVGSVNTDLGAFWIWDLGALAAEAAPTADGPVDQVKRQRYIDCIMASAAIPVAFPPVYIDQFQHVDGGTMRNVFIETVRLEALKKSRRLNAAQAKLKATNSPKQQKTPIEVYLLLNGKVEERGKFTRTSFMSIGIRSLMLLMNERMVGNVYRAFEEARSSEGLLSFYIHSIPKTACEDPKDETHESDIDLEHGFNKDAMACLACWGRKAFDGGSPWFRTIEAWEDRSSRPINTNQEVERSQIQRQPAK
ncbi:MAG: patatin-like phospholipase family protein [Phycisphaerales bacterium]|nr:patatin-like phospholipase family protein [Phycisphaerales bacterium]